MMKTIILISCVSKKGTQKCKAKNLYTSDLFKKAWTYANSIKHDDIYILSAKHGLLNPDTEIEPYDVTLNTMKSKDKQSWVDMVMQQFQAEGIDLNNTHFIFLAGKAYCDPLIKTKKFPHHERPYDGCKGIGYILQFLNNKIKNYEKH